MAKSPRLQKSPLCNDKALAHTMAVTGESAKFIKEVLDFHSKFIADKIKIGGFESVRIWRFGNFRPKLDKIAARGHGRAPLYSRRINGGEAFGPIVRLELLNQQEDETI